MAEDPEILLAIGTTYYQMKDYPSAISSLQKVTEMRSAKATQRRDAFLTIARAYSGTENREELDIAKSFAYKAARIAPGDHEAQLVQTSILLKTNSLLDRERAIDILRSITASDIEAKMAAEAHNLLGLAYYKNGEFSRALNSFDQSLQLNPTNKSAYNNQRLAASALEETRGN